MRGLTYREKVVLLAIAQRDGTGGAWHSYDTLAAMLGVKRGRIAEAISALESKGALSHRRTKTCNVYAVDLDYTVPEIPDPVKSPDSREKPNHTVPEKPGADSREKPGRQQDRTGQRTGGGQSASATSAQSDRTPPLAQEGVRARGGGRVDCRSGRLR